MSNPIYYPIVRRDPLLVSYWRLNDPASATEAIDWSSHNSLPGFITGAVPGPAIIKGDSTSASLSFDGTDNISIPDIAQLRVIGNVSLEAWIVPYVPTQSTQIIAKTNVSGIASPYSLALVSGVITFTVGNGSAVATCSGQSVPVGIPSHVVATLFRGALSVYLNGQICNTTGIGVNTQSDNGQSLFIGKSFNGLLSEVALYNGALSALKVARHYAVGQQLLSDAAHFVTVDPPAYAA